MPVPAIGIETSLPLAKPTTPSSGASTSGFGSAVERLLGQAEGSLRTANDTVAEMLDKTVDTHEAMIALQQADLTLQFTVQVRNKLVQAYQEIMRMPV